MKTFYSLLLFLIQVLCWGMMIALVICAFAVVFIIIPVLVVLML